MYFAVGRCSSSYVVRVVHAHGQHCAALGARDVLQVNLGAVEAPRVIKLPLATKLARRGRQRAEALRLVLSLGVPDTGGPVRLPEALAPSAPVPDAGLGLHAPPLGHALAAHTPQDCTSRAGRWCAVTETEERQRLSTLHGCGLHLQAHRILLAFGRVCLWNAAFCFLAFAFVLRGAVLDRKGLFTSGCADKVLRLLLLGTLDVNRHCARLLVQKLLTFCLTVAVGVASLGSFSRQAHSWYSSTASRCSNASSTRARLHLRCLIILAGSGSCGAQRSGPPSAPRLPGAMVVSSPTGPVMRTTASDVALRGRHLNEVSASTVGEFTAAVGNSAVDKILLGAGTYELTSDMCTGSAVCIDRALTIEAEVPGAVVLNAMGARRVFEIKSVGTAELIGLNITGGSAPVQSARLLNPLRHFLQFPANRTHV